MDFVPTCRTVTNSSDALCFLPVCVSVLRRVIWLSEAEKGRGYAVGFLDITLHAVSRDPEAYPSPCLYTQVIEVCFGGCIVSSSQHTTPMPGGSFEHTKLSVAVSFILVPCSLEEQGDLGCGQFNVEDKSFSIEAEADSDEEDGDLDSEADSDSQLPKISEMRIILADAAQLDSLFDAFCHCAELNPDPTAEENEDSDLFHGEGMTNGGWIHGDEDEHMVDGIDPEFFIPNPIGQNGGDDLSSSVLELQINDQRFEDAEEEEARENGH
uniref:Chloride conductance regulatory protein ICln n=1 Tax=Aegilops tauschii TaxID=37682 RepID=M8BLX9_AEGTA